MKQIVILEEISRNEVVRCIKFALNDLLSVKMYIFNDVMNLKIRIMKYET